MISSDQQTDLEGLDVVDCSEGCQPGAAPSFRSMMIGRLARLRAGPGEVITGPVPSDPAAGTASPSRFGM
jgi:hypothetical protein